MADLNGSVAKKSALASPNSVPAVAGPSPATPDTAIKNCWAAWKRAYRAYMKAHNWDDRECFDAEKVADQAYREAMPHLTGLDGIRNFIACAAQGILFDVIPQEKSGSLLYAAQVAMSSLSRLPKETDPFSQKRTPTPSPSKKQGSPEPDQEQSV